MDQTKQALKRRDNGSYLQRPERHLQESGNQGGIGIDTALVSFICRRSLPWNRNLPCENAASQKTHGDLGSEPTNWSHFEHLASSLQGGNNDISSASNVSAKGGHTHETQSS